MPTTSTQVLAPTAFATGPHTSGLFTIPSGVTLITLIANIPLADKLAVGETVSLDLYLSTDGGQTWPAQSQVGFGWTSYGPDGYTSVDKQGNVITNPDPSLSFNPSAYVGQKGKLVLGLDQDMTIGATVVTS